MRIGVFGGSFDPVHSAHLIVAQEAAEFLKLDHVRFVPAAIQPFKPDGHVADTAHRVAMLRLALSDHAAFLLDLREIERGGISYTADTLAHLRHDFPDDELFLLVGADAARHLSRWHDSPKLAELAQIVAMSRSGETPAASAMIAQTIAVSSIDVSATAVRRTLRSGSPPVGLLPKAVADYIRIHDVYRSED